MPAHKRSRMTQQRRIVLEALRSAKAHPTADEVYEMVRQRLPRISLGTVYRNLEVLSEAGAIRKLELGGALRRFDGDPERHDHVRCSKCGRVDDLRVSALVSVHESLQADIGYDIEGYRLEFVGMCPQCRGK